MVTDFHRCAGASVAGQLPGALVHATSASVDALMIDPIGNSDIVVNARSIFDRGIAEYVLGAVLMFAKDALTNLSPCAALATP